MLDSPHKKQLDGLLNETIIPALFEDFDWKDQNELDLATNYLIDQIKKSTGQLLIIDED